MGQVEVAGRIRCVEETALAWGTCRAGPKTASFSSSTCEGDLPATKATNQQWIAGVPHSLFRARLFSS